MAQRRFATLRTTARIASICILAGMAALAFSVDELKGFLTVYRPMERAGALVLMAGSPRLRLPAVAKLYQEGVADTILLANDGMKGAFSQKHQRNLQQAEWSKEYLLQKEIPEDAIKILGFTASGSYYDAINTRAYVATHNTIKSLLVVTSDYHTRRTLWTFETVFADMHVRIGVYPVATQITDPFKRFHIVMIELAKLFYYKIRYAEPFSTGAG